MVADDLNLRWYAVRVRPRHEKCVSAILGNKGYQAFLPTYISRRKRPDRFKNVELPLFPGYLFCRFDLLRRLPILVTPGVVQIVGLGKVSIPVDDSEVEAIQAIVASRLAVEPWSHLEAGQQVRIEEGPLRGVAGILLGFKPLAKLVVSVKLLQRAVAVQVDREWVVPAEEPSLRNEPMARPERRESVFQPAAEAAGLIRFAAAGAGR
jgi:transcription antitermination factor NusG